MAELLRDGIYLDLPDHIYFAQRRMGSSDWKNLSKQGEGWWWSSIYNPYYEAPDKIAYLMGHAGHVALLEGLDAYEARYIVEPDKRDYKRVLYTVDDIKTAMESEGHTGVAKSSWKKPDYVRFVADHMPSWLTWDGIMQLFEDTRGDKTPLSSENDFAIRSMYAVAMADESVKQVLGHDDDELPVLAEVSYLWTDEFGIRRRARFDKLVPADTLDLKTLANFQKKDLKFNTGSTILYDGLCVQVADQHEARKRMYAELRERGEDAIVGGTEEQRMFLYAMAVANKPWAWVWLFFQKPDRKGGLAPVIFPVREEWGGVAHRQGVRQLSSARDLFMSCVARFGLNNPWSRVEPVHTTSQNRDNSIMLPDDKYWALVPVENEERYFER